MTAFLRPGLSSLVLLIVAQAGATDLATLQQNYEQMRLTMAQATDSVIIAETARRPENPVQHRTLYMALAAVVGAMLAAVAGVMVFISFDELLPAAREYDRGPAGILGVMLGMTVMAISLLLL